MQIGLLTDPSQTFEFLRTSTATENAVLLSITNSIYAAMANNLRTCTNSISGSDGPSVARVRSMLVQAGYKVGDDASGIMTISW